MDCPSSNSARDPRRTLLAALFGAAVLAGLAVPPRIWGGLPDLCLFHRLWGLPCPTCGLTRSWSAVLHGQPGAAFRFHLFGPALLAAAAGGWLRGLAGAPLRWPGRGWIWGCGLVWSAYALARMAGWFAWPP